MDKRLSNFIKKHKILYNDQYGFRKNYSFEMAGAVRTVSSPSEVFQKTQHTLKMTDANEHTLFQ